MSSSSLRTQKGNCFQEKAEFQSSVYMDVEHGKTQPLVRKNIHCECLHRCEKPSFYQTPFQTKAINCLFQCLQTSISQLNWTQRRPVLHTKGLIRKKNRCCEFQILLSSGNWILLSFCMTRNKSINGSFIPCVMNMALHAAEYPLRIGTYRLPEYRYSDKSRNCWSGYFI